MGVPADSVGPYEEMMDSINSGWIGFGVAGAESIAGAVVPAQVSEEAKQAEKVSDQGNQPVSPVGPAGHP